MLEGLNKSTVQIKDRARVEQCIKEIVAGGKDRLQVVADFDRTLSKFKHNGKLVHTCHNTLDESERLPDSYRTEACKIRDHYYAIEVDHNLSKEEKEPYMVEWWTKAHEMLEKCHLTKEDIAKIVEGAHILLRDGVDSFFANCDSHEIPLLIFSAGLGNIIEEVIKQQHTLYNNMKIVSNWMGFDDNGKMTGFVGELIHIYNKNESAIHDSSYFKELSHRDNIILLGDSLGDLHMADGAPSTNVLKIGFLNDKIDVLLPKYLEAYDIVLVSDETYDVPNSILNSVLPN